LSESSFSPYMPEIINIIRRLFYLRHRLKPVLPEDLLDIAPLRGERQEPNPGAADDYNVLFDIGAILAQQQEPVTMGELGRALGVPLSTATRIVNWLVKSGYAERRPDPEDRRVVRVALTEQGQTLNRTAEAFIRRRLEMWLQRLTPEECQMLVILMSKFVDALEEDQ
jgi:DNA-binding MarR family transcriptional regulator